MVWLAYAYNIYQCERSESENMHADLEQKVLLVEMVPKLTYIHKERALRT